MCLKCGWPGSFPLARVGVLNKYTRKSYSKFVAKGNFLFQGLRLARTKDMHLR